MPRPVKASLERWTNETDSTFSDHNMGILLDAFSGLQDLYPELGKFPRAIGPFDLAQELWIISLNVLSGNLPEDWSDSDYPNEPSFYEPALSSRELRKKIVGVGGGGADGTLENLGLKSFPLIGPPSEAADGEATDSGTDKSPSLIPSTLRTFGSPNNVGATLAGSLNAIPSDLEATPRPAATTSTAKLDPLNFGPPIFDQIADSAAIEPVEIRVRDLPDLDDPEDQQIDEAARHRLANGIKEQHVVGLAFAMPSTIHTPSEFDTYTPDIDDGVGSSGEGPKAKRLRLMDQGPKSYDIGILLKLDEVREKIFTSSGLFITEKVEEALTQDAIFNLLLDLEPTIDPCGVLQFQVLIVPTGGPTHDKMVSMFVNM